MDYKESGVDIDAGNEAVRRIRELARGTFTAGVLSQIGSFGGLFRPDLSGLTDPVLVSSADGVGTKLKVAFRTGRHGTVGGDLVNHCVNDILVQGARPLFFLDYVATGRLSPGVTADVVAGMAAACVDNGCALLGGETAEMPGFYADGEYDLAGFIVGLVDRARIIDGRDVAPGDVIVGLPSTGLHTNGYSLARRILFEQLGLTVDSVVEELGGSVGDELLRPHCSYLRTTWPVVETGAEVLLISSLNGEAEGWGREIKLLKAKYKNLDDLVMMIGGNLVVGSGNTEDIVARYKNYGFDLVCHQVDLGIGLDLLAAFIEERAK